MRVNVTKEKLEEIRGEIDQRASNAAVLTRLLDCLIESAPSENIDYVDAEVDYCEEIPND